jgi:hypothetical protein
VVRGFLGDGASLNIGGYVLASLFLTLHNLCFLVPSSDMLRSADSLVAVSLPPRRCSWRLFLFVALFCVVFVFIIGVMFVVTRLGGFRYDIFEVDCFVNPKGSVVILKPRRVWFV